MRFVVSGAGGFLGSHLVRELLTQTDHEVLAITSKAPTELIGALKIVPGGTPAPFRKPHVVDTTKVLRGSVLRPGDVVVNAAFPWNRGGFAMANGLEFLTRLFQEAAVREVQTFVNISSQSVYSQARTAPAHEGSVIDCDSPYATAKYALELAGAAILPKGTICNARMSSLIGVGYDIRLVNRLVQQIVDGQKLTIKGGDQSFDFMDVRDAARALITVGERGVLPGSEVLNIGTSNELSLREIVTCILHVTKQELGADPEVEWQDDDGDRRSLGLDTTVLQEKYGFRAEISFEESVRTILRGIVAIES